MLPDIGVGWQAPSVWLTVLLHLEISRFPTTGWGCQGAGRASPKSACVSHVCLFPSPPPHNSFEANTCSPLPSRHSFFPSLHGGFGQVWVNTGPCGLRRKPNGKERPPWPPASVYEIKINQETGINCLGKYICNILTIFIHGFYCDIYYRDLCSACLQHRHRAPSLVIPFLLVQLVAWLEGTWNYLCKDSGTVWPVAIARTISRETFFLAIHCLWQLVGSRPVMETCQPATGCSGL